MHSSKRFLSLLMAIALAVGLAPVGMADAVVLSAKMDPKSNSRPVQGGASAATSFHDSSALNVTKESTSFQSKKASKAYRAYLAKRPSYKYFRVVKMGNGGVPVLLCADQRSIPLSSLNYVTSVDVMIYKKSQKSHVKKIGTVSTGGSSYRLHYAKGVLCGGRIADAHTFSKVIVKSGYLSMSGMYDNLYSPYLAWRHFSHYNPATMGALRESGALGNRGTEAEYSKLIKNFGSHPLSLYKNSKINRNKRI